jgi:hypothetical protein
MDAEERETWIGYRVHETADERAGVGRERVVVAPERDDPLASAIAGHRCQGVGPQAATGHEVAG